MGNTTTYEYNDLGQPVTLADPLGNRTKTSYDAAGQLLARVLAENTSVAYTYDQAGRRTSMTDTTGLTRYGYDPRGALVAVTHPDGKVVASSFDAAGNRVGLTFSLSSTGEENLIEAQSGNPMNDLEYRRKQLLQLQDAVVDLEDLSTGVSSADLTLTDFRIDLAEFERANPEVLDGFPLGVSAVVGEREAELPPGIVFCLRAEGDRTLPAARVPAHSVSTRAQPCRLPG